MQMPLPDVPFTIWISVWFIFICTGLILWAYYKGWLCHIKSRSFTKLHTQAFHEVIDICEELGVTFWITEGTLIGALRYGCNHPEDIDDIIDDDIDIMIEVESHKAWMNLAEKISRKLALVDWKCSVPYSTSQTKGARPDKLQCRKCKSWTRRTHVDFHSYLVDQERGGGYTHEEDNTYPFQRWGGYVPLELIMPLKSCLYYDRKIPCPQDSLEILKHWDDGQYEKGWIALPLRTINETEYNIIKQYALTLHQQGYCSMYPEFENTGIHFENEKFGYQN